MQQQKYLMLKGTVAKGFKVFQSTEAMDVVLIIETNFALVCFLLQMSVFTQ